MELIKATVLIASFLTVFGAPNSKKGCGNNPADLVFVLDESGSIWGPHFTKQLEFVQETIRNFDVRFNQTHVGVLTFGTKTRIIFPLGKYTNEKDIEAAVKGITQKRGETYTHAALKRMREEMFSPEYTRPWVRHLAIVITDGESNFPSLTAQEAALAHKANIQMLAVGVGPDVVKEELESIATNKELVFTVDDYGALKSIQDILAWKACEEITTTSTTTTTTTTTEPPPLMIMGCNKHRPTDQIWSYPDQINAAETNYAVNFIREVTQDMVINPDRIQVGLCPRYCGVGKAIRLNEHESKEEFVQDLDKHRVNESKAEFKIHYIRTQGFNKENGGRVDAVKFGILMIDNRINDQTMKEAELAKESGIKLIVIGMGNNINEEELRQLASSSRDYYSANQYSELWELKQNLIESICEGLM